ncbi:MAG: AAA family ATPase [Janthinobacterium lividum]
MATSVPRLTYLRIKNCRALRDVEFRDLTPLTVLIGPNGSGKSTVLDALDFLAEAVRGNLVRAWEKRNWFEGMRTRGSDTKIEFEIEVLVEDFTSLRYQLNVDEWDNKIFVADETLILLGDEPVQLLRLYTAEPLPQGYNDDFRNNFYEHDVTPRISNEHSSTPLLASILSRTPVSQPFLPALALAELLTSYRLAHLTNDHLKGYSDAGPRERLSPNGDNLPNVLYYLHLRHPEVLARITAKLKSWVPRLADVVPEITSDKRILLRFKDAPGTEPLPARYMSGGTMRLAALLTLLRCSRCSTSRMQRGCWGWRNRKMSYTRNCCPIWRRN